MVGKYFKRITSNSEYAVYKIVSSNENHYIAIQYYFAFGYAKKDRYHELNLDFAESSSFDEIDAVDFSIAETLFKNGGRFECENDSNWERV